MNGGPVPAPPLTDWESFYVIVGSSAAALTGLCLAGTGVAGLVFTGWVAARAQRQKTYRRVPSDWVWFVALPGLGYASHLIGPCHRGHDAPLVNQGRGTPPCG